MAALHFNKVAIVGVGLIGGSLSAAMKAKQLSTHIVGIGRKQDTLETALALGLVDSISTDMADIAGSDLVVLCAPVAQTHALLTAMLPYITPQMIVTDAGSTKQDVVAAAKAVLGQGHDDLVSQFVPAHPIAGKERHGPEAAQANLYENKRVVITPLAENRHEMVEQVRLLWQAVGAEVSQMSPVQHDAVFSAVSHMPHLLAYALVSHIAHSDDANTKFGYAGAGFRDFTRIAASSPEMWCDIFLANQTALLKDLRTYQMLLGHIETMLVTGNKTALERMVSHAAVARQEWGAGQKGI